MKLFLTAVICKAIMSSNSRPADSAVPPTEDAQTRSFHPDAVASTLAPAPAPNTVSDLPSERIGPYRLIRCLGRGGMGTVFEAEELSTIAHQHAGLGVVKMGTAHEAEEFPTGRHVAVKLIASEAAASREAVARFRQEGQLASAIVHPRCVFVLAADEDAGRPYIVMELMQGTTLKDLVEREGPLPPEQAVAKIMDVIDGLQEAHRLGVIHRDVKPSNCFLEADGRVKIGDFGLAKLLVGDSHLSRTGSFLGTPLFSSPEQIRKDPLDGQTDVYSLAATLYYVLTGRAPFDTGDPTATIARIVSDPAPSMCRLRAYVPRALDKVVLRGLEKDKKRRWRDLECFRLALLPFCAESRPLRHSGAPVPLQITVAPMSGMPDCIGSFQIEGALIWDARARVLVGEDKVLRRKALLWLRPLADPTLNAARRASDRTARLRWLGCGRHTEWQWDAFAFPSGSLLPSVLKRSGQLPWAQVRSLLEQLTAELSQACKEGTVPARMSADQVLIQPDGGIQLLDMPLTSAGAGAAKLASQTDQRRALAFIRELTSLALGRSRSAEDAVEHIPAPLPKGANRILDRLMGAEDTFQELHQLQEELTATQRMPTEVSRWRRFTHLLRLVYIRIWHFLVSPDRDD